MKNLPNYNKEPLHVTYNNKPTAIVTPHVNKTNYIMAGLFSGLLVGLLSLLILPAIYLLVFTCAGIMLGYLLGCYKKNNANKYEIPFNQFGK